MDSTPRRRTALAAFVRPLLTCLLIVAAYYAMPIEPDISGPALVLRGIGTAAAGLAITWLILRQVAHQLHDPMHASLAGLVTAIIGGVTFFALADYAVAIWEPGQFEDLATKTDALYFALTTLSTVGYGDVHAAGQLARGVVVVQLVFNVVIIATGASVLAKVFGARVRERVRPEKGPSER